MNRKLSILRLVVVVLVVGTLIGLVGCGKVRAIDDAAQHGYLGKVKTLLKANPDLVFSKEKCGGTALHFAADGGHMDVAEFLLANKADVNAKNCDGVTPLHMAVVSGHKDIAELLRQHGGHE